MTMRLTGGRDGYRNAPAGAERGAATRPRERSAGATVAAEGTPHATATPDTPRPTSPPLHACPGCRSMTRLAICLRCQVDGVAAVRRTQEAWRELRGSRGEASPRSDGARDLIEPARRRLSPSSRGASNSTDLVTLEGDR